MLYPKAFQHLVDYFRQLPGVGQKTAERYAFAILDMDQEQVADFSATILESSNTIKKCQKCGFLTDGDYCQICEDEQRDQSIICVVSQTKDVIAMENTQEYHGLYHVLNGVISTSKGILPNDLNIDSLLARVDTVKEVIIATSFTVEGETTALYLAKLLAKYPITVTRLAHGLPMGGHLDYADELTLIKAMEGRKKID